MKNVNTYHIDENLEIDFQDCGQWRSYHIYTQGDTLQELIEDATISEIDQDGGELDCYGIEDTYQTSYGLTIAMCSDNVRYAAMRIILETMKGESI